jgi:hypothetical protein
MRQRSGRYRLDLILGVAALVVVVVPALWMLSRIMAVRRFEAFIDGLSGNPIRETRENLEKRPPSVTVADVEYEDTPLGFRQSMPDLPDDISVVRYTKWGVSMHIIYDADTRVVTVIPTFE